MRLLSPALLLLASCAGQPPIAPGKIVSNNPCVDGILAEVADPAQIGAVSAWSHNPASASAPVAWARRYPAIGTEAEAVILARPRLALIGAFGRTDAFEKANVPHASYGVPATISESARQVRELGTLIGQANKGEQLARAIEASTQVPRRAGGKSAIIWLSGGFVPGKGTLQDELLTYAGYRNASAVYGLRQWDVLPLETLIRTPPDVIFTPVKAGGDAARTLALRERVLSKLVPKPRLVAFPERLLNCGGPSVIAAMQVLKS